MKTFFGKYTKFENIYNIASNKIKCGWCDSIVSPNRGYNVTDGSHVLGHIYICPNCNEILLYNSNFNEIFPKSKYGNMIENLPSDIETIYEECRDCYSVGVYTSIMLLARKLLMHISVECGADKNLKFFQYVEFLDNNHYIPPKSKSLLTFIKDQGNEANHEIVTKNREDADKLLKFLTIILTFIYEFADKEDVGGANGKS